MDLLEQWNVPFACSSSVAQNLKEKKNRSINTKLSGLLRPTRSVWSISKTSRVYSVCFAAQAPQAEHRQIELNFDFVFRSRHPGGTLNILIFVCPAKDLISGATAGVLAPGQETGVHTNLYSIYSKIYSFHKKKLSSWSTFFVCVVVKVDDFGPKIISYHTKTTFSEYGSGEGVETVLHCMCFVPFGHFAYDVANSGTPIF